MTENVTQFPKQPGLELIGPFEVYKVKVHGRIIPKLTARRNADGVLLVVDGRYGASFSEEAAQQAAWLIAQALAIGEGYPHLGAENKNRPFAPLGMEIKSDD